MSENVETIHLINTILEGVFTKKGENVVKLDMRQLKSSVCDYFIICHAQSSSQVDAIAESVVRKVKTDVSEYPLHKEGLGNCNWVLLDYSNVIVHIFMKEFRDLYNLEGLWADAEIEVMKDTEMKQEEDGRKYKS